MFYQWYELNHASLVQPVRAYADSVKLLYTNPLNPLSHTAWGRSVAAMAELFERTTRRYGKPRFDLPNTTVDWKTVAVAEKVVWSRPFCNLINFERAVPPNRRRDPKLLIVAPMSGHYATLLRGTVEAMLPHADVYITDWTDARMVPVSEGKFDLDDYIDYVIDMLHKLGPDTHVMAVCQPSVPVLAAAAIMEARGDRSAPSTMTLMGGPIDTRRNPTAVNTLAEEKGHRLVPRKRHHAGAMAESGLPTRGLSRLPAAFRLHEHESRPAYHRPQGLLHAPGEERRRQCREASRLLR